jgi:poly(hydroxyalkanoate) depolymerase family esterase
MNHDFAAAMRRAAQFTGASDVAKATQVIQDAIAGRPVADTVDAAAMSQSPSRRPMLRLIKPDSEIGETSLEPGSGNELSSSSKTIPGLDASKLSQRFRKPLGEVLQILREGRSRIGTSGPLPGIGLPEIRKPSQPPPIPDGAQFSTRSFTCAAGTRSYKLYIPTSALGQPRGLVVMLHGCKQDPDDFATGTNMNAVAEAHGILVAYPAQSGSANPSSCWNWFNPADQMRDAGEPSILAGITREIMAEFHLDRERVFVAGLSAGGAMAAVMGETYPDLYAAVGIHSGLAYKSATDVVSAFAAMRGEAAFTSPATPRGPAGSAPRLRTIVMQGTADQTVNPSNAARIVEAATGNVAARAARREQGASAGGRTYNRIVVAAPDGDPRVECWFIKGAGHAWSGGHAGGSFTDPQGPDASAEMMRFFLKS